MPLVGPGTVIGHNNSTDLLHLPTDLESTCKTALQSDVLVKGPTLGEDASPTITGYLLVSECLVRNRPKVS